jgi:hypothetical protein
LKAEAKSKKSNTFTCPNPSCGKVFTNPLKAVNLNVETPKSYDACPYCLTEMVLEEPSSNIEEKPTIEEKKSQSKKAKLRAPEEKVPESPEKEQKCPHHFGYLGERSPKEGIPDDCIVCKDIVQCMLKNVKG